MPKVLTHDEVGTQEEEFNLFHDRFAKLVEEVSYNSSLIVVVQKHKESDTEVFGFGKTKDLVYLSRVVQDAIRP